MKSLTVPTLRTFLLAVWLTSISTLASAQAQPTLPVFTLEMAGKQLKTEMASTPNQRFMGLSFRKKMAQNEAMLFVYQVEQPLTFTMRNTLIPLSIAYISKDFVINEIHHMPVGPNQLFPSKAPAKYALEVNEGWFARNKVSVGTKINFVK